MHRTLFLIKIVLISQSSPLQIDSTSFYSDKVSILSWSSSQVLPPMSGLDSVIACSSICLALANCTAFAMSAGSCEFANSASLVLDPAGYLVYVESG